MEKLPPGHYVVEIEHTELVFEPNATHLHTIYRVIAPSEFAGKKVGECRKIEPSEDLFNPGLVCLS